MNDKDNSNISKQSNLHWTIKKYLQTLEKWARFNTRKITHAKILNGLTIKLS